MKTPSTARIITCAAAVLGAGALTLPAGALAGGVVITGQMGSPSTGLMWTGFGADGALAAGPASALGTAFSATVNPVVVTPTGTTVIVAEDGTLRAFHRDPDTGTVSAQVDAETPTQPTPKGLALTPAGDRLYVVSTDNPGNNFAIDAFSVGADGALTPVPPSLTTTDVLDTPVVSPDGQSLYVMPLGSNRVIHQYDIGPSGALTPKATPTVATGNSDLMAPVFTGGGTKLVAIATTLSGPEPVTYSIDPSTGSLTPPGSFPLGTGNTPLIMRVSPTGTFALIAENGQVRTLPIGADGTPGAVSSPVMVAPAVSGAFTYRTTGFDLSPDGRWAYMTAFTQNMLWSPTPTQPRPISIPVDADGNVGTPVVSDLRQDITYAKLIVAPVRPSIAALTVSPGVPGATTTLDAGASTSPDAPITSYRWTFGDGSAPVTNASPTVTHTYAAPGTYATTVTVTNSAGCGINSRFDGMRTVCNGSVAATATVPVTVVAPGAPAPAPTNNAAPATPLDPSPPTVCAAAATATIRRGRVLTRAAVAGRICAPGPGVRLTLPSAASRRACTITRTGAVRGVRAGRCTVRVTTTTDGGTSVRTIVVVVR